MAINIEDIMSEIRSDIQEKGLNSSMLSFADVHHGHIELDSAEGVGSTFSIFLPIDKKFYRPEEFQQESTIYLH